MSPLKYEVPKRRNIHKLDILSYDGVIGPEYNLGGKQFCILHKNGQPARLVARVRALFRPVTAVARWTVSAAMGIRSMSKWRPQPVR